ncbi:hypothetical protein CAOG_00678 [Capsaspora owczarzaki ATCC 30864]|uniref:Uncharacterized protein n=1 Tax=Capsaspora owczarzaki (strain ATCC 30864) TaxID=595528 RepID=A0A0D2WJ01_CAPO3|nr:hypothetical protein CAOG_00678 [Capsaspora owczarzaki ATCC 30864]KJE89148.1 hypothetical protein CAOG_000678 [Capsaspora owczarzaki ATCC 30864]|eukprot:XP_004365549.1 hypothetical protein CAOG_00678 [Capsaspora owczarzaki ATCC 30864]
MQAQQLRGWSAVAVGVVLAQIGLLAISVAAPPPPQPPAWPSAFNTCVSMYVSSSDRDFVRAGWYLDEQHQAVRLDSYGVPLAVLCDRQRRNTLLAGRFAPDPSLGSQALDRMAKHVAGQCGEADGKSFADEQPPIAIAAGVGTCQLGPPLYVFIWHFDLGIEWFIAPGPEGSICHQSNITAKFPAPLNFDSRAVFQETSVVNGTELWHWRTDYFLFSVDAYFRTNDSTPYQLIYATSSNLFSTFNPGPQNSSLFEPPSGVICAP